MTLGNSDQAAVVRLLDDLGHWPTLSPDGQRLVYVRNSVSPEGRIEIQVGLHLVDLASGANSALLEPEGLLAGHETRGIGPLAWSPDGEWLVLEAQVADGISGIYAIPATGGTARVLALASGGSGLGLVGFSPDGRYLAHLENAGRGSSSRLVLIDWADQTRQKFPANLVNVAWSPVGHLLAIASKAGLYVIDPVTGATRWVGGDGCRVVGWLGW